MVETARALSEGYYVDNFNVVLDHVSAHHDALLTDAERDFRSTFQRLSQAAQRLYVRLMGRKGPLFRADLLRYPEIESIDVAIGELERAGFADAAPDAGAGELVRLLRKPELAPLSSLPASTKRAEIEEDILACCDPARIRAAIPGRIVQLHRQNEIRVFRLLFFGNLDQDLTEFILDSLAITPYERYPIDPGSCPFRSREVVEQTCVLYELRAFARETLPQLPMAALVELADAVPSIGEPVMAQRAGRLLNRIARQLERLGEQDLALGIYERTLTAPSRERQARIHAARGNDTVAIELCESILRASGDESEFEFGVKFPILLSRRRRFELIGWPEPATERIRYCDAVLPPDDCRVEESARGYWEAQGHDARYVENSLFPGLFGLAFWDIIFHPVDGAFMHPFQRGPLDLFTPAFRERRRDLIERRLREVEDQAVMRARVMTAWQTRFPLANHFVFWGRLSEALLSTALERIPPAHLIAVFERLLRDPQHNRSGFPDLIVFPAGGGYRLVEVKGPGDTLQANQRRWLRYFDAHGIPAQVQSVAWAAP